MCFFSRGVQAEESVGFSLAESGFQVDRFCNKDRHVADLFFVLSVPSAIKKMVAECNLRSDGRVAKRQRYLARVEDVLQGHFVVGKTSPVKGVQNTEGVQWGWLDFHSYSLRCCVVAISFNRGNHIPNVALVKGVQQLFNIHEELH